MKKLIVALALIASLTPSASHAWDCPPGVPDTKENQDKGICVEKKPHKTPTGLPTPSPTKTTTPMATPAPSSSPSPHPAPISRPATLAPSPGNSSTGQICVYETTTGQWEIRQHQGDVLEAGQEWPIERDLCDQHHPVSVIPVTTPTLEKATPTVVPVVSPEPVSTPEPVYPPVYPMSACIGGNLVPILDDAGEHMLDAGLPMWLWADDDSGTVVLGELCPIAPTPEPYVPVQIP